MLFGLRRLFRLLQHADRGEDEGGIVMPVTFLRPGETGVIQRVGGAEDTKRFLANLGFVDGSRVSVVSRLNGGLIVNIKNSRVALNKEMAKHIIV